MSINRLIIRFNHAGDVPPFSFSDNGFVLKGPPVGGAGSLNFHFIIGDL